MFIHKGEACLGFDKINNNAEDVLHLSSVAPWSVRQDTMICAPSKGVWRARALSRRAAFSFHVDTCIFPRDKTVLTMGKPEVNPTFIPSLIHVYLRNSARARPEVGVCNLFTSSGCARFFYESMYLGGWRSTA